MWKGCPGDITLTANLDCSGDGLIIGDDGTIINWNGFVLCGPGADSSKVGIGVSENNTIIRGPGNISGFQADIGNRSEAVINQLGNIAE
jgi:hypothetical protein